MAEDHRRRDTERTARREAGNLPGGKPGELCDPSGEIDILLHAADRRRDLVFPAYMENIFVRLDKIDSLPVSTFPDISDEQKAWAREEIYWSRQVDLYNFLLKEKGKKFALDWFCDGAGYFLGAKTWVPFVAPTKAFILYLCWEQANLRGNKIVLERLDDHDAIVKFTYLYYFEIYEHASHFKQRISYDDYRQIFEAIWQDRATNAGWSLEISYKQPEYVLHFKRSN